MAVNATLDSNSLTYGHYDGRHMTFTVEQTGRTSGKWTLTTTGGSKTNYSTGPTTAKINGSNVYYKAFESGNTDATKPFPISKGSQTGTFTLPTNTGNVPFSLLTWIWYSSGNTQSAIEGTLKLPYTRLVYKPGGATISSSTNTQSNGDTYYVGLTSNGYISYSTNKNETEALKQYIYYNGSKADPYNYTTFNLVKTGYSFDGWSNNSTTTGAVAKLNQNTEYYADQYEPNVANGTNSNRGYYVTLTATWKANTYTVTFNANNGTIPAGSSWTGSGSTATKTVTYDSTYGTLPTPTKAGHYFEGWYTAQSGGSKVTSSTKVSITGNQTLYARWTTKTIHVIFQKNDGSGDTADQYFTYGLGSTKNKFGYTTEGQPFWGTVTNKYAIDFGFGHWYREGYKILGWSHSNSATAKTYNTYSGVSNDWIDEQVGNASSKDVKLYAVWDFNGLVRIYTEGGWKMAIPYVYNEGWKQALPYVYNEGWKQGV